MGKEFPKFPDDTLDGDEVTFAPTKADRSLLAAERGTDSTRRIEVDASRNLMVNVAADSKSETLLHSATLTALASDTPTAFAAYAVPSTQQITRVLVWGDTTADFTLRLNASEIGKKGTLVSLDADFVFSSGYPVVTADSVDVVVEHFSTGKSRNFKLYIYGA